MQPFSTFLLIFSLAFLITGCGQSGPLYLPPKPTTTTHHIAVVTP